VSDCEELVGVTHRRWWGLVLWYLRYFRSKTKKARYYNQ